MSQYQDYLHALNNPGSPVLFLDLDALEKNIQWALDSAGKKTIRLATKSLRSREILRRILQSDPRFQGLMTFDLREALWLRSEGFKDILMGYPTADEAALNELAENPRDITLMADLPEHVRMLEKIAGTKGTVFSLCLDVDLSLELPLVRFGVYRSRIRGVEHIREIIEELRKCSHVQLKGVMGYEAQIAGVMDKESALIRKLKKISVAQLRKRREEVIRELSQQGFNISLVNGGGTGSLDTTSQESVVTEVTVGSGFYAPLLFDHYQNVSLRPALMFTLPIVRHPLPQVYTCLGGGYIASGAVEKIKSPAPYLPHGLTLLRNEGAGEVQTPLKYSGSENLEVGKCVIMRHAKAGEICERFSEIILVRGKTTEGSVRTYRGEGKTFV